MQKAFTLIELLIVIAILAILLTATLVAMNPQQQFYKVQETKVHAGAKAIRDALFQCELDHIKKNDADVYCYIIYSGDPQVDNTFTVAVNYGFPTEVDLCPLVYSGYLSKLPVNSMVSGTEPLDGVSETTCDDAYYSTGFQISNLATKDPQKISVSTVLPGLSGQPELLSMNAAGMSKTLLPTPTPTTPTPTIPTTPTPTLAPLQYTNISTGENFSCGLTTTNKIACWGDNTYGQLGNGTNTSSSKPVLVSSSKTFYHVTTGKHHACGYASDMTISCWGENAYGQLLTNNTISSNTPMVSLRTGMSGVTAKGNTTCFTNSSDVSGCAGFGSDGFLNPDYSMSPDYGHNLPYSANTGYISKGIQHGCWNQYPAYSLMCWGSNQYGQLGDGTTNNPDPMVDPYAGPGVSSMVFDLGSRHTCAVNKNNTAQTYCWGNNASGELGNGTTNNSYSPTLVAGSTVFTKLSSYDSHTCGITNGSKVRCWGLNSSGQIGNGTTSNALSPTAPTGDVSYSAVSAGLTHTCAVRSSDQKVECWGNNASGQLGNGTTTNSSVPVLVSNP